jgi:Ferritin-like domain
MIVRLSLDSRETVDRLVSPRDGHRWSRGVLLRNAALAGGAMLGGGVLVEGLATESSAALSRSRDRRIFRFALQLEFLQAGLYREALERGKLGGELREFAETADAHERAHVAFLRKALGRDAPSPPRFRFGNATHDERKFGAAALELENLAVAAYNGQGANLTDRALSAAATIVSVEGRHAAWISDLMGRDPAPRAADPGATAAQVTRRIKASGFLAPRRGG